MNTVLITSSAKNAHTVTESHKSSFDLPRFRNKTKASELNNRSIPVA
jgi:hypothetical protein